MKCWKVPIAGTLLLPLTLLVAGCGDAGTTQHAAVSQYDVQNTPAPDAEQILHRRLVMSPQTLDPSLATGIPSFNVIQDLFEGLLSLSPEGSLVPGVASSWEVQDDGKTYLFHLRPEAKWSNGEPLTARDFVYAWQRQVDPATGAQYADSLSPIVNASAIIQGKLPASKLGVSAVDDHTFKVQLNRPTPYFLTMLYNQYLFPIYKAAVDKWGDAWTRPEHIVSNGAFKLTEWVINGHLTLQKNLHYWDAAQVRLQQEIYYPINAKDSVVSRYLSGDIDMANNPAFAGSDTKWLKQALGDQVKISPYYATAYLSVLLDRPPFNNKDLRLAMNLVLDRDVLSNKIQGGLSLPAYSLFPPLPGYTQQVPEWAHWPMKKRIAEAQRLYKKAGYSKTHPLQVEMLFMTQGVDIQNYMEALATMWNQSLGSDITLRNEEWKVMLQDRQLKNAKLFWNAWVGDFPEPYTFAQLHASSFTMNYGGYDNPAYDKVIDRAGKQLDDAKRFADYQEGERILNQDMPAIPLYFYKSPELVKPYVAGVKANVVALHLAKYIYILQHSEKSQ